VADQPQDSNDLQRGWNQQGGKGRNQWWNGKGKGRGKGQGKGKKSGKFPFQPRRDLH